jgi:Protein of unknown function (DUF2950)
MTLHIKNSMKIGVSRLALLLVLGIILSVVSETSVAATANPEQTTYTTPEEAGKALESAARTNDDATLAQILGSDSKVILSSGDPEEDKAALASFVAKYARMNRWVRLTDGSRILYIGADNYPYPIPLMQNASSRWYFATAAGKDEILARRIGQNELLAMDAVYAMGNAEELYFKHKHDGENTHQYTQKILSSPGKQDGLYWEVASDQPASPLGRLDGFATDVVSSTQPGTPPVFDGYAFRVLAAQGNHAKGKARRYVEDGEMTGGFAILAVPVTYGDAGIMTFMMSREGVVYQKDLGPKTAEIAVSINSYDPDNGWTQVK